MCNRHVVYEGDMEYHIVLPSNACEKIHPDNTPSKYTVSWETPYQLYDLSRWRVAMTEITFNHIITSINPNYGIEYGKLMTDRLSFRMDIEKHAILQGEYIVSFKTKKFNGENWPDFHIELVKVESQDIQIVQYKIRFSCMQYFEIVYISHEIRKLLGMENNDTLSAQREEDVAFDDDELRWQLIGNDIIQNSAFASNDGFVDVTSIEEGYRLLTTQEKQIRIKLIASGEQYVRQEAFYFTENKYFSTIPSLVDYVNQTLPSYILKNPLIYDTSTKRCKMTLNYEEVNHVRFLNGFNYVLGFENMQYDAATSTISPYVGAYKPQLTLGLRCMYIYASICKPIQVGDVQVPLLQTVWPDDQRQGGGKYSLFQTHTTTIERPMYLGVNTSNINSIEINIRSDSGELVSFPPNSITSIKLHLKKV